MKLFIMLAILLNSLLMATEKKSGKNLSKKHLKIQMEKEKKYAREQKFYSSDTYDFSSAEVNPESLKNITVPETEDDFDMDDVYD